MDSPSLEGVKSCVDVAPGLVVRLALLAEWLELMILGLFQPKQYSEFMTPGLVDTDTCCLAGQVADTPP